MVPAEEAVRDREDQMRVIDRKCHDLKYQVAAMRHIENPTEREKNLKELEQSIRIYDSIVKTGNEILDTLLSEKSLICEARDITMHCVIDGKKLFFMDSIDIYALFGNAIDNAIECVEKFSEKEMRFIDICVAEKQHFYISVFRIQSSGHRSMRMICQRPRRKTSSITGLG